MPVDEAHWNDLASLDPQEVIVRAQAQWDPRRGFGLPFLNDIYWIHPLLKTIQPDRPDMPIEPHLPLLLALYLLNAQNRPLQGVMVTEKELPGGVFFFRRLHKLPTQRLEDAYGTKPAVFLKAGRSLGGRILGSSPPAFELTPLPRVVVAFRLWPADEEFPARCVVTFDASINTHLPLDVIWAMTNVLVERLTSAGGVDGLGGLDSADRGN
jgi:hypothetical protein